MGLLEKEELQIEALLEKQRSIQERLEGIKKELG